MSPTHRPRILVCDDHLLVAEALKSLLAPEFDLVGVVEDGRALIEAVESEAAQAGYVAIETFARRGSSNNPSGPLVFYMNRGYEVIVGDADFPLVRKALSVTKP